MLLENICGPRTERGVELRAAVFSALPDVPDTTASASGTWVMGVALTLFAGEKPSLRRVTSGRPRSQAQARP